MSNSLLVASLALDYLNALTRLQELQQRTAAEGREPTDAELDELGRSDDGKRVRFQDAIDKARAARLANKPGGS